MRSACRPGSRARLSGDICPLRAPAFPSCAVAAVDRGSRSGIRSVLVSALALVIVALSACALPPPVVVNVVVTATPVATATPMPTWTPTPVPTATPIPPAYVEAQLPGAISPLVPVPVEALFVPPPGIEAGVRIDATVMDPVAGVYATFELSERYGDRYRSPEALQLPLEPLSGFWWLIVHAETQLPVEGAPALFFEIEPVTYRDLTGTLPSGVTLRVPVDFRDVVAQGNQQAGGRVWQHRDGEVALWWAPGPTEALLLSNALVALEATYAADRDARGRSDAVPAPVEFFETEWQGQPAFEFPEMWPGSDGGPGRAWVIQGADDWLYILRVRALGRETLPSLHVEVANTFAFTP
ncbi:MAG: hypothetical protein MUQ30_15570 [Anaerolineae bacterium]|nr:hypothetical protein [Anaerolineae bacterium]